MQHVSTVQPAGAINIHMHPEKLQAFVLSTSDYGESDRIVSLFTLEHGRLKGFARGARNSRKRFGPALETFARIDIQLTPRDGLYTLRGADITTVFSGIRSDLGAIAHALYACELVENLTPEGMPLPRLYRLLATYLEHLDSGSVNSSDRRMFEVNLLNIIGYRPSLERCSSCDSTFDNLGALIRESGELVCRSCAATGRRITLSALQQLSACLSTGRFGQIIFDEDSLAAAGIVIDDTLASHSSKKIKSLLFLQQTCCSEP